MRDCVGARLRLACVVLALMGAPLADARGQTVDPQVAPVLTREQAANLRRDQRAARAGDAEAQLRMGQRYAVGAEGLSRDAAAAVGMFRKAAAKGSIGAWEALGLALFLGDGVVQDQAQGMALIRKAADAGSASAQFNIGTMYRLGEGVRLDYAQAIVWLTKSADLGEPRAQDSLAHLYINGQGMPQDVSRAMTWFRKAAEQNHADAQYNLAVEYHRAAGASYLGGAGADADRATALMWLQRSANQGFVMAGAFLGRLYTEGYPGLPRDYGLALQWLNWASLHGDQTATARLGLMSLAGEGVPKDGTRGLALLTAAADAGYAIAQADLGITYFNGTDIAPNDGGPACTARGIYPGQDAP